MGTRGVYGIQKNNEQKLMYNHFDSYPEGLGLTVLHFISNHNVQDIELMFDNIIPVQPGQKPTQEQINLFKEANVLNRIGEEEFVNSFGKTRLFLLKTAIERQREGLFAYIQKI